MLDIKLKSKGETCELVLNGSINTVTAIELEKAVNEVINEATDIILDCTDLEYTSSAGLRVFVSAQKRLEEKGGKVVISHPNEEIMDILEAVGFDEVLTIIEAQ